MMQFDFHRAINRLPPVGHLSARTRHAANSRSVDWPSYIINSIVTHIFKRPELTSPFAGFKLKRCVRWSHRTVRVSHSIDGNFF